MDLLSMPSTVRKIQEKFKEEVIFQMVLEGSLGVQARERMGGIT